WMWRNHEVRDFVEWLRDYNTGRSRETQVGFYGIDLYSLFTSIQAVLACFDHAREDSQAYGYSAAFGMTANCEDEVVQQLSEMNRRAAEVSQAPGLERDAAFYAQQNARLVRNAEEYYRTMFRGRVSSW